MGRPSDYNEAIALAICERLTEGESLRAICREDEMPGIATVFRWLEAHLEFRDQYARARELQADVFADELTEISDDARNDWMKRNHGEDAPAWVANGEHIQRSRLRIDTRKWIASKLKPKRYGEKLETTHQGPDGGPIVVSSTDAKL